MRLEHRLCSARTTRRSGCNRAFTFCPRPLDGAFYDARPIDEKFLAVARRVSGSPAIPAKEGLSSGGGNSSVASASRSSAGSPRACCKSSAAFDWDMSRECQLRTVRGDTSRPAQSAFAGLALANLRMKRTGWRPPLIRWYVGRTRTRRIAMQYLRLDSQLFDRQVTLRDAYKILEAFVVQYNARGESSTVALMTDIGVAGDGAPSDPAQIYDFARVAGKILRDEALLDASRGSAG